MIPVQLRALTLFHVSAYRSGAVKEETFRRPLARTDCIETLSLSLHVGIEEISSDHELESYFENCQRCHHRHINSLTVAGERRPDGQINRGRGV